MTDVNITELRQNLPAYLEKARRGQRFLVTSRGRVIAQISPPTPAADEIDRARELLKGSVLRYDEPFAPAIEHGDWDVHR
jgi:prevent-host-death family protein